MEGSAAVFLAEVLRIENDRQSHLVTLQVERWWKGGDSATLTVSTAKSGAACGYNFRKGERYLVYAHGGAKDKPLRVSLCSRTRTAKAAKMSGDFKELGEGKAPSSPTDKPPANAPVGRWDVEFANGVAEVCEIRGDGTARVIEPRRTAGGVSAKEGAIVIVFEDDRVERWTRVGERMVVELWSPAARFPSESPVMGIANRRTP